MDGPLIFEFNFLCENDHNEKRFLLMLKIVSSKKNIIQKGNLIYDITDHCYTL